MNIGDAAERSGLPAKTIRYYEDIGLVKPGRKGSGYRDYGERDLHQLRFLQRARSLGFTVEQCRQLLSLYVDPRRTSSEVKAIAQAKVAEIDQKLQQLRSLRDMLDHLVDHCRGDNRPDCPIIDELAGNQHASDH